MRTSLVDPSTLWRWRTGRSIPRTQLKGKRRCGRRYKFDQEPWRQQNLKVAAALIAERRRGSHWVDYETVAQHACGAGVSDPETEEVLSKLKSMVAGGIPADLIATACCAALRLGPRIRRYRRRGEHNLREASIAANLKRMPRSSVQPDKYPELSDEQIRAAFRQNPDHRWVRPLFAGERAGQNERPSTVCVSKVFGNINRNMASYYRRSNPKRFALVVRSCERLQNFPSLSKSNNLLEGARASHRFDLPVTRCLFGSN